MLVKGIVNPPGKKDIMNGHCKASQRHRLTTLAYLHYRLQRAEIKKLLYSISGHNVRNVLQNV